MKRRDDSQMSRFEREGLDRFRARDAVIAGAIVVVLLIVFAGGSVRQAADQTNPGFERDVLAAVAKPTSSVADGLPFAELANQATRGLSPDSKLGAGGFAATAPGSESARKVPPVTPEAFDPATVGGPEPPKGQLGTLLVTGDSLSTPLDLEIAKRFAGSATKVVRDPHLAAAITRPELVDWGALSTEQVANDAPDAVVIFLGANEFYPLPDAAGRKVECCNPEWAALFANRVRQMMNTYRQGGAARVYWLTVPTPRDPDRARISKAVNAAIEVAAEPWRNQVRVIDTVPIFTPGGNYTDSISVDGSNRIVRESDGVHLNEQGASIAAEATIKAINGDFETGG